LCFGLLPLVLKKINNSTEEKKWEIKIKQDKVQLRFQQNSWYRTRGHKIELSKTNENDNKTHILWQWKATNSQILTKNFVETATELYLV
jgi:hypothetical protein